MIDRPDPAIDATFGGYLTKHSRPPAFEGTDGSAYSASLYVSDYPDETGAFGAAILFVRWSTAGDRPVGHVETPVVARGATREEATSGVEGLSLLQVKELLDEAIRVSKEHPDW
jgi:hypothetical protein